jgi:transcriptional regulator with XRE-family HTH domain
MTGNELLVMNNLSLGQKVRLARLALHLRQIDVASKACVSACDVTNIEKDRLGIVPVFKREAILKVLGLSDENEATN